MKSAHRLGNTLWRVHTVLARSLCLPRGLLAQGVEERVGVEEFGEVERVAQQAARLRPLHPRRYGDGPRNQAAQVDHRVRGSVPLRQPAGRRLTQPHSHQLYPTQLETVILLYYYIIIPRLFTWFMNNQRYDYVAFMSRFRFKLPLPS